MSPYGYAEPTPLVIGPRHALDHDEIDKVRRGALPKWVRGADDPRMRSPRAAP